MVLNPSATHKKSLSKGSWKERLLRAGLRNAGVVGSGSFIRLPISTDVPESSASLEVEVFSYSHSSHTEGNSLLVVIFRRRAISNHKLYHEFFFVYTWYVLCVIKVGFSAFYQTDHTNYYGERGKSRGNLERTYKN